MQHHRPVALVQHDNARGVFCVFQQLPVLVRQGFGGVEHHDHHVRARDGLPRPIHADALDHIRALFPQTRRVGKVHSQTVDQHIGPDDVPGGAGNVGDDGAFLPGKGV